MKQIILASQSPRRLNILEKHGISPLVRPTKIDEIINDTLAMENMVMELALNKARACFSSLDKEERNIDGLIIGSDTIVFKNGILGKPTDRAEAREMLQKINDTNHKVCTGVAIIDILTGNEITLFDTTDVWCKKITDTEIEDYLDTEEPYDKAGAYAIQGIFGQYIDKIEGDYENVVGLPWHIIKDYL